MKIKVYVQPAAKKSGCAGYHGEFIKIKLKSPPADGAANAELTEFIAETLGLPKSAVSISSGQTSRTKTLDINTPLTEPAVLELIAANKC